MKAPAPRRLKNVRVADPNCADLPCVPACAGVRFPIAILAALVAVALCGQPYPAWSLSPAPVTELEDMPSAKPQDVTRLLAKIRRRHGEDAVVIQTHLLLNAMQKGSVLATGVRVERVQEAFDKRYLLFVVETGMIFDDSTRDRQQRAQVLWASVMEPTLDRLKDGLQVEADGMMVQMEYHHRPYRSVSDLRGSIDRPGTPEVTRFHVLAADLDQVVRGDLTLRNLVSRAHTTIDGAEIAVPPPRDDQPLTPGPD